MKWNQGFAKKLIMQCVWCGVDFHPLGTDCTTATTFSLFKCPECGQLHAWAPAGGFIPKDVSDDPEVSVVNWWHDWEYPPGTLARARHDLWIEMCKFKAELKALMPRPLKWLARILMLVIVLMAGGCSSMEWCSVDAVDCATCAFQYSILNRKDYVCHETKDGKHWVKAK